MASPQGIQITASKVHVPFKTELINTISSPRFAERAPHLVGILATDKEDARTYAEVSDGSCERNNMENEGRRLMPSSPRKRASRLVSTLSCGSWAMPEKAWTGKESGSTSRRLFWR